MKPPYLHRALTLALLASSTAAAQTSSFHLKVDAREVIVDLLATDPHNHPILDLKQNELQLFALDYQARRSAQPIASFRVIAANTIARSLTTHAHPLNATCPLTTLHYQLAYRPGPDGWTSGYHRIAIITTRPHTQLFFRQSYYVGVTNSHPTAVPSGDPAAAAALQQAACYHPATPLSIPVSATPLAATEPNTLRYSVVIPPDALPFLSLSQTSARLQLDYGICTFSANGQPLNYLHTSTDSTLSAADLAQSRGLANRLQFPRDASLAAIRIAVRDRQSGNTGSINIPVGNATPQPAPLPSATDTQPLPQGPVHSFGSILPQPNSLCGDVYELPPNTTRIPNFWDLDPIGSLYTDALDVPNQRFTNTAGIPGITSRTTDFGIDYSGFFWIQHPGDYEFDLLADGGARLLIDNQLVIDLDGNHFISASQKGHMHLDVGLHSIHVPYYQGPPVAVALVLRIKPPRRKLALFRLQDYTPPSTIPEQDDFVH